MMAKPWNEHRATITKLYIQEGRTLEDVRGIMKTEYNFEASIRSYRQHFDIWDIGKYNCKKRQQRRRQSLKRPILPSPLRSPPALSSSSETSDPGSSPASSCASQRSPEQLPLPALQQTPRYAAPPSFFDAHQLPALQSSSTLPEPRIKVESGGGGGTGWRDMPMYPSAAPNPPQSVLQSSVHYTYADSAHWHVPRPPLPLPPPPSTLLSSNHSSNEYCGSAYQCVPKFPRHGEMATGLRAPNLSMVRGHGRHGALHPPSVSLPVSFQGVASG
ncbi:Clr5 domain-containing protein [Fusarium keratoplasticum]|nr:Clr5 domain-containing protein [Fusarium keratoplasticum]